MTTPQNSTNDFGLFIQSSRNLRWAVLALSCIAMTGIYYSFDIPAALHQQLEEYMAPVTKNFSLDFNLLYSSYSIPNIILPFFGGNIVYRLGSSRSMFLFACLSLVGQILFAVGSRTQSWAIMLTGRTIYGFGGESIGVASSTLNSQWFEGKELALSFGINLALSRMGSVLNNMISPKVANTYSTPLAIWVGVFVNSLSVTACILLIIISGFKEQNGEERIDLDGSTISKSLTNNDNSEVDSNCSKELIEPLISDENEKNRDTDDPKETIEHLIANQNKLGRVAIDSEENMMESLITDENQTDRVNNNSSVELDTFEEESYHFAQLNKFGTLFWILSASCMVVYSCILPFNNVASGILFQRNYFKAAPSDCLLKFPNKCAFGTLVQGEEAFNPATHSDGSSCELNNNIAPVLPQSINITRNSENDSKHSWKYESYIFDALKNDDVDCEDTFWSKSCTSNYCSARNRATEKSGRAMSIPYCLSASLSPLFGIIVDKIGCRALITLFSSILLVFVHLSLAQLHSSPVIPLIGQGLAYSSYAAAIWPSVPLAVEPKYVGTAFGAITSIQNAGLAIFPLIISFIYNASHNQYIPQVEIFFVICALIGTVLAIILNVVDSRTGSVLNRGQTSESSESSELIDEESYDDEYVSFEDLIDNNF